MRALLVLWLACAVGYAEKKDKLKNVHFKVDGVGSVRIKHDVVGEPISQPERLEVFMTCLNTKKSVRLNVYRMCIWDDYTYEPGTKTLYLKLIAGRVDPKTGDVKCDQVDEVRMDLAQSCRKGGASVRD